MNNLADECVILGSGESILSLTDAERAYLNSHPHTLAPNKFLLFHEKAGIVPRYAFLADHHYPAPRVFVEMVRAARRLRPRPIIYAHENYRRRFQLRPYPLRLAWQLAYRWKRWRRHGYWIPLLLGTRGIRFFRSDPDRNDRPLFWGESLDDELFFFRGSLTTAINLATVIFPGVRTIKLVGVDLNSGSSFFQEELDRRPELTDSVYGARQKQSSVHLTAVPVAGYAPIQSIFPEMVTMLAGRGIELVCCNPESLLCLEGICRYEPVLRAQPADLHASEARGPS